MKGPNLFRKIIGVFAALALAVSAVVASMATGTGAKGTAGVVLIHDSPIDRTAVELPPFDEAEVWRTIARGQASYYGPGFAGRQTANGETFHPGEMTAAHKTLPFGTKLRVTNVRNGRSVIVRVNDRGPYVAHRIIDLSQGAASRIGMVSSGTAQVHLEVMG